VVHAVPVKQEKELVNLSWQQKFMHKKAMLEKNGGKATKAKGLRAELGAAPAENPTEELNSGHRSKTSQ